MKKFTLYIAILIGFVSHAQWNIDTAVNTLVASSDSGDVKSIGTSDGQTYVVFWKEVAAPTNYELRVQLLDASGNQQLGADGALISNTIPMNTFTAFWTVTIDGNDNLYVGVTGTDNESGWAYKVDTSGTVLWTVTNPSAQLVKVLPMASGDAIVAWLSTSTFSATMQKYDSSGNSVWTTVSSTVAPSAPADLYEISSGNYILVYHQLGSGVNSTLYAQRFDVDGNAIWSNPAQLSNKTTQYNAIYNGTTDGDVVYYGYPAKTSTRIDAFVQRINPDGTLPWGINGMDFDINETNYEKDTQIAISPGSSYVWAICNYTDASQSDTGEYVQKFDKVTGTRQFTDTAKQVYAVGTGNTHAGALQLLNDQPLFLIKSGFDNGATPVTLNACLLDANGDFVWTEEIKPVATYAASKGRIHFNTPVNGQVVTVFTEDKGTGEKVYAQNFTDPALSIYDFNSEISLQYINPVQNELKLKSEKEIQSVIIVNTLGQEVVKINVNSNEVDINVQSWEAGMYFVNLTFNNGISKGIKILKR
ncbi:T9SS type A sorting domain-containing protein [Hanstruepera marina]|uniref:T9SS type A sorting domain-containing protein n=1 Tax=Hanstruepera marina TaxID=2873265 RepID=UPI001CA657BD|nr:T9SS type A sorting domain-containing protein [Hanstruepera marina]